MRSSMNFALVTLALSLNAFAETAPTEVIHHESDTQLSVKLFAPGTLPEHWLKGILVWTKGEQSVRLGDCPARAYPDPQGAYVLYQKDGKLVLAFRHLDGSEEVFSKEFEFDGYTRRFQVRLNANGIVLISAAEKIQLSYAVGRKDAASSLIRDDVTSATGKSLDSYGVSLVQLARESKLTRPITLNQRFDHFARGVLPEEKSLCLVGPGDLTGSDLVFELAHRLARNEGPAHLQGWDIFQVNIAELGTEGKADLGRMKISNLIKAATLKKVILYFDGLHRLVGMGGGSNDLLEDLLPAIQRKDIYVIATSAADQDSIGKLDRRSGFAAGMRKYLIEAYDPKTELPALLELKSERLRAEYNISVARPLLERLISEAGYHFPGASHPTAEFTVLDRLVDVVGPRSGTEPHQVHYADIRKAIYQVAPRVPYEDRTLVDGLQPYLEEWVVGQPGTIERIVNCYKRAVVGSRDKRRPICIFFALGSSGVGKTFSAELLQNYFQVEIDAYRLELFREAHTLHTLIGAPPSYVESGKPGALVNFILRSPTGVLLLDELDKAHPDVIQALDPLFDEGVMRDYSNTTAHFNRGTIFMTSNFGIDLIKEFEKNNPDFRTWPLDKLRQAESELINRIRESMIANRVLPPWVIGRIPASNWMVYHTHSHEESVELAKILARAPVKTLGRNNGFELTLDESVYEKIVRDNINSETGARPIKDAIELVLGTSFYDLINELDRSSGDFSIEGKRLLLKVVDNQYRLEELK